MESVWPYLSAQAGGEGKADKTEDLRAMGRRVAKSWFELFDNELRKVLNIPQLGLTRYYQEHAARAIEEYNDFQTTITNFVNLLTEPLIETTEKVREQVRTAREGGEELVKDAKEHYKLWINELEAAYLELLKSAEYTSALTEVLKALRDYKVSRQQLLIDLFQDLPVPTHKDMDELYKELYYLKKRVKELEKRGKKND
jgi:polyhydroxyalkanoate synthesis regulator phasin